MSLLTYNAHFNSIKVRLEQIASSVDSINVAFQFHKGTIKTYMQKEGDGAKVNFNSIKVRLKHVNREWAVVGRWYFNSIKVRLKLDATFNEYRTINISIP